MNTWKPEPDYTFRAFAQSGKELANVFSDSVRQLEKEVEEKEEDDYILNVNEMDYFNYLVDRYTIEFPTLDFDNAIHDDYEKDVPVAAEIRRFYDKPGLTTKRPVYVFMIPYTGPSSLLNYRPSQHFPRS